MYGHVLYREPSIMKEYGDLWGIQGSFYTRVNETAWYIKPEGDFVMGSLVYDGRYSSGEPVKSVTTDTIFNVRLLLGVNINIEPQFTLKLFTGGGYRSLTDKIHGTGGYRREITYSYLPIGFETELAFTPDASLGFSFEYDVFLEGKVKSYLSDVSASSEDPLNKQTEGYGLRLKLISTYRLEDNYWLTVEPYYQYWEIEDSEKVRFNRTTLSYSEAFEPHNDSRFYGVVVSLRMSLN